MNNPLVSIIVITYNSSKYVLETLESAKAQTYQNIELIISDDGSIDNTVEICKEWLEKNKDRFIRTELIASPVNTGIPANCNRGLRAAQGEWVKFIAGDDLIDDKFIEISLKYIYSYDNIRNVAFSYAQCYLIDSTSKIIRLIKNKNYKSGNIFKEIFFLEFWPPTPAFMFNREKIELVGGFDETLKVEDFLLVLKLMEKFDAIYINIPLAYYRKHTFNLSNNIYFIYKGHLQTIENFKHHKLYKKALKRINLKHLRLLASVNKKEAILFFFKNIFNIHLNIKIIFIIIFKIILPDPIKNILKK